MTVTSVTAFNITIEWGEVPCPDQNGVITGYSVQYGVEGSGGTETATIDGDSSGGSIGLSGLEPATVYEYRVAAMTSAGPGVYSSPMTALTSGTYLHSRSYTCVLYFSLSVEAPTVISTSVGAFSISVSWSSSGAMVDSYEVLWDRATPDDCPNEHTGSATVSGTAPRSYDIMGLFGDSAYIIRVNATNAAGSAISGPLVVFAEEHGNPLLNYVCNVLAYHSLK